MTSTSARSSKNPDSTMEELYRAEWGRLLSRLVARTRRIDLAEDALGEAFVRAAQRWPHDGLPSNPAGWLYTTAFRQVVGRLRAEAIAGRKTPLVAVRADFVMSQDGDPDEEMVDDRLHLILLCCHPALPRESQSALALRLVVGTSTEQIARLFLVPTATMAARLTRAKKKIVVAGIPLGAPVEAELRSRLDEVCRTIYLSFTTGYTPGVGPDLLRADLAGEAVQLAAVLHDLVAGAPQIPALRALLLFQHSRRDARVSDGRLITLANQDRSLWHRDEIATGLSLIQSLGPGEGYAEELRLQALIAAEHARALAAELTDWAVIADHFGTLEAHTASPIVRLNRAVAVAEADNPEAGLALLTGLDAFLPDNHRLASVRADLAQRAGNTELAQASYRQAIELCHNVIERHYLQSRLADIDTPTTGCQA